MERKYPYSSTLLHREGALALVPAGNDRRGRKLHLSGKAYSRVMFETNQKGSLGPTPTMSLAGIPRSAQPIQRYSGFCILLKRFEIFRILALDLDGPLAIVVKKLR